MAGNSINLLIIGVETLQIFAQTVLANIKVCGDRLLLDFTLEMS